MICISKVRKFKQNYETTDFEKIMKIWVTSTFATNKERSVIDLDFHYIFFFRPFILLDFIMKSSNQVNDWLL